MIYVRGKRQYKIVRTLKTAQATYYELECLQDGKILWVGRRVLRETFERIKL